MIRVRYFAGARDLAGCREECIEDPSATTTDLRIVLANRHPPLRGPLERMRLAVNGEFADEGQALGPDDEVDVMPPVAGGSPSWVQISSEALSIDSVVEQVRQPTAGGIAIFLGVVRNHAEGKAVAKLDYEAHPDLALKEMQRVLNSIVDQMPTIRLAASHRIGSLAVGDLAVVVAASAPHRAEAFEACRLAIDRIKETVPIWKHEWAPDGSANWVNL